MASRLAELGAVHLVGDDDKSVAFWEEVKRAAATADPVLITGETGTGKDLVAMELHRLGPRRSAELIACNCADLSRETATSELFGHERGAFTGADKAARGLFRRAEGGILFLDELGELSTEIQAKLLRAIQQGEVRPVGGTTVVRVDVRVIAATNRPLLQGIADPQARVRIEDDLPSSVPAFVGMHLRGGFLASETLPFSPNLTCIIGGRGSGKSTAFHALRAACGKLPPGDLASSEAWPEQIDVVYRDEFGTERHVRVEASGEVSDMNDPFESSPVIPIESLAQGEMARTIERCGEDPAALLDFLDGLTEIADSKATATQLKTALEVSANKLAALEAGTVRATARQRFPSRKPVGRHQRQSLSTALSNQRRGKHAC